MSATDAGAFRDPLSLRVPPRGREEGSAAKDFVLYVMDISYFSGKVEMFFRYMEFKFERNEPTLGELEQLMNEFGTSQVPLVRDMRSSTPADLRCLRDSTSIIEHLGGSEVIPLDPVTGFLAMLMDDFADEYMWRPAMFSRWGPEFDSTAMGLRWTFEFCRNDPWYIPMLLRPTILKWRQQLFSVTSEGVQTPEQYDAVWRQYLECLDALNTILESSPFLLGEKPSVVDFAFTGPFFRHFYSDPTPRKIMEQRAPNVTEWIGRMWNAKRSRLGSKEWNAGFESPGWAGLWPLVSEFLQYADANANAWLQGNTSFDFSFRGVQSTVQTVPFRVWSLDKLRKRFAALDVKSQESVKAFLAKRNAWSDVLVAPLAGATPGEGDVDPPRCMGRQPPGLVEQITHGHSPKWGQVPLAQRLLRENATNVARAVLLAAVVVVALQRWWRR